MSYQIRLNTYCNNGHTEKRSRTEETENFHRSSSVSPFFSVPPCDPSAEPVAATIHADLVSLSVEQIEVASFETTVPDSPVVVQPYTAPQPNCYSPFCMPTALLDQCPETGTAA